MFSPMWRGAKLPVMVLGLALACLDRDRVVGLCRWRGRRRRHGGGGGGGGGGGTQRWRVPAAVVPWRRWYHGGVLPQWLRLLRRFYPGYYFGSGYYGYPGYGYGTATAGYSYPYYNSGYGYNYPTYTYDNPVYPAATQGRYLGIDEQAVNDPAARECRSCAVYPGHRPSRLVFSPAM